MRKMFIDTSSEFVSFITFIDIFLRRGIIF